MATATIEERLALLEEKVARLTGETETKNENVQTPWWEKWVGAFANDPMYDEAMRLGAEYRKSQPTAGEVEAFERVGGQLPS